MNEKLPTGVKEVRSIKGTAGRESYRKQIVKVLAEGGVSMPLNELPGWLRDIKELENQGLIYVDDMKMVARKRVNLTEKGKSYVVYEKTESRETLWEMKIKGNNALATSNIPTFL